MADLNSYTGRVLEEQDKILMREASACLTAGANRAAYITVWLATAESLRRKFTEAAVRDHRASDIVRQIQGREAAHKAVDAMLIDKAKEYGFITDAEATRLQHLYENRNVFGHPYEQRPSDQLVETAASESVDIVLGRPIALREGYLSQQVTRLTADLAFLSDDQEAVEDYARLVHARCAPDLRVWLVRKLLRALDGVFADPSTDELQRRNVWFLRTFLLCDTTIFDEWDAVDDLPDHPAVLPGLLARADLFALLSNHAKDIVVNTLIQAAGADPRHLELLWDLQEDRALDERHQEQLSVTLSSMKLSRLTGGALPLRAYWERVVDRLRSHSWNPQNDAIQVLRAAGPAQVAELDAEAQEELGRNVMQAAEGTAFSAVNLLGELTSANPPWPPKFVEGAVLEPFVASNGELRLKTREMERAVRSLRSLEPRERNVVVDRLLSVLGEGSARDPWRFRSEREGAVEILRDLSSHEDLTRLDEVVTALQAVDAEDRDLDV